MSQTVINGATQIKAGSIPWSAMASGAIVPIASIVNGAKIILNDASVSMAASLNAGGYTVTNGATPVNASDLATKAYIDAKVGGIGGFHDVNWLQAVNIAATSGLTLAGWHGGCGRPGAVHRPDDPKSERAVGGGVGRVVAALLVGLGHRRQQRPVFPRRGRHDL